MVKSIYAGWMQEYLKLAQNSVYQFHLCSYWGQVKKTIFLFLIPPYQLCVINLFHILLALVETSNNKTYIQPFTCTILLVVRTLLGLLLPLEAPKSYKTYFSPFCLQEVRIQPPVDTLYNIKWITCDQTLSACLLLDGLQLGGDPMFSKNRQVNWFLSAHT